MEFVSPVLTLCYHDVLTGADFDASGFTGRGAATYKITLQRFREHLATLREHAPAGAFQVILTFDDGGSGAMHAADALEQAGCRGFFFITTARVGTPGFLAASQIAELSGRGHVIGSHGVTHRGRMNRMPEAKLMSEWRESAG